MNNRSNNQYFYRNKRKKKFRYYCHNGKPFFYHKKYKGNRDNANILLQNNEPKNDVLNSLNIENDSEQLEEFVPEKKQEDVVLQKSPVIKMVFGIVLLVAIVFSVSYAYFNFYYVDSRQADITMGEAYVRIPETAASITLTKVYPRTDTEARSQNNNYFDFTVNSKNTSSTKVLAYELNINDGAEVANKARISRDYIKVDLQEKINSEYVYVLEGVTLSNFAFEDEVPINTNSDVPREFRLRLWMADTVLISDTEPGATYTQTEFANLYATYHIEVNAIDKVLPRIASCPKCNYMYTTTTYNYGSSGTLVENITDSYSEDYRTAITSSRKYFLGFTISNNKIDKAYACGVKEGVPFCIEGPENAAMAGTNITLLQSTDLYNNSCNVTNDTSAVCEGLVVSYTDLSATKSAVSNTLSGAFGGSGQCYADANSKEFKCIS